MDLQGLEQGKEDEIEFIIANTGIVKDSAIIKEN